MSYWSPKYKKQERHAAGMLLCFIGSVTCFALYEHHRLLTAAIMGVVFLICFLFSVYKVWDRKKISVAERWIDVGGNLYAMIVFGTIGVMKLFIRVPEITKQYFGPLLYFVKKLKGLHAGLRVLLRKV